MQGLSYSTSHGIFLDQRSNPNLLHWQVDFFFFTIEPPWKPKRRFFKKLLFVSDSEVQAGTKIARRNINNLRYADDTMIMTESEEELKSLLMKVKEESEKVVLKQHSENKDHGI